MSSTPRTRDRDAQVAAGSEGAGARRTSEHQRELNILRVATDLYPEVTGGGAIHAHSLSERQAARGHDVTVLTSDHGHEQRPRVETRDGYEVVRHRELARPFENSITPGVLRTLRRKLPEADVVHGHSHLYFTTNVAAAIGRLSDTPLVVTNHGLISQTGPNWLQRLFIPTVARFTFNSADRVLCYTETEREQLRERNVTAPIEVIRNGIGCERFTPPTTDRRLRQLLFVGRLTDAKGVPTLLEAFASLASEYPDLGLRVVGDGPERGEYERTCERLGIDHRVRFVGDVPYAEMPRYYRESLAFVLPSHSEGMPRTVLEAMACETPVVTTSLPQLESVVDGAGFTVEEASPASLADAIRRLLDDDATRRQFGRVGRRRVIESYSWSETVERTTGVLADLAD